MTISSSPSREEIMQVLAAPQLPRLYANGFSVVMSNSDVSILLLQNGAASASLSLSYTTAKSLCGKISAAIEKLEAKSGQPIMTTDDIGKFMQGDLDDKDIS